MEITNIKIKNVTNVKYTFNVGTYLITEGGKMGKKSKKHTKIKVNDRMAMIIIDAAIGSDLLASGRHSKDMTSFVLANAVNIIKEASKDDEINHDPHEFLNAVVPVIQKLYNDTLVSVMCEWLVNGVPDVQDKRIITLWEHIAGSA